ncbi:MAG: hypothetical protein FWG74_07615 [Planctomycetes bacterium]|nr:hypothetical protein [Planctomycetota bacterium]
MMPSEIPYYYGRAENKLNSKNQVAVPARFRSVLPEEDKERNYVLIWGSDKCLYMYTHRQFGKIVDNVRQLVEESKDWDFFRSFMAEAYPVDIDTQGRFVLPQAFMKAVGIQGPNILFIGVGDRIEIWDPGVFAYTQAGMKTVRERLHSENNRIFGI